MELVPSCFYPQSEPEELSKRSQLSGCSDCTHLYWRPAEPSLDMAEKEKVEKDKSQHNIKIRGEF